MKFQVAIFILTILLIQEHECTVKTIKIDLGHLNPKYVTKKTMQVVVDVYNETYNYELFHWNLPRDLPEDVTLRTKVFVIKPNGEKVQELLDITIPVCKENTHRQSLPEFLVVPKENLNKACILKGNYYSTHVGQLKAEALIPDLKNCGKLFLTENLLSSHDELILDWVSVLELVQEK